MKYRALLGGAVGLMAASCSKQEPPAPPPPPPPPSVVLVSAADKDPHFEAVRRHLELGGELYGYVDIDGDVDAIADNLKGTLARFGQTMPQLAAIQKADPKPYLRALGVEDVKALGFSSVAEKNGEYRNRFFLYLPSGRRGIFAITGGRPAPPKYLDLAPADADLFEEIDFDVDALASAVKQVWIQTGNQQAEAKFEQGLIQSGQGAGVSVPDIIRHLRGRLVFVLKVDPAKTITIPAPKPMVVPAFQFLMAVEGIGADLQPVLDRSPFLDHRVENDRRFYVPKMGMMLSGLRPAIAIAGTTFYFTTDEFFLHQSLDRPAGSGLGQNPEFQRLQNELGRDVNTVAYVTPRLLDQVKRIPALNPDLDANVLRTFDAVIAMLPMMKRPQMQVLLNTDDGILLRSREFRSLKPALAAMMVYPAMAAALASKLAASPANTSQAAAPVSPLPGINPGGPMMPGAGLPPGGHPLTKDQRVQRNLRVLAVLARNYYRRTGSTTATYSDLIGPGKPWPDLPSVEGEDYRTVKFEKGKPVQVTLPDGRVLSAGVRRNPPPATAPSGP